MHRFMEKLLEGATVEWRKLGEVAELKRGRVISKNYLRENQGSYPVYSSQTLNNGEIGKIDTYDFDGEYVNWTTDGAHAGTVFYRIGKFSITNVSGIILPNNNQNLNTKYLYYWLSVEAKKHVYSGMGNPKLMSNQMAKVPIPIPPLEVQREIVRILDNFTELTAELTAELSARRKQYSYYRDRLLSFGEDEVEWKKLGEIAEYSKQRIGFEQLNADNYVGVDNLLQNREGKKESSNVPTKGKFTKYLPHDILIGNIRPYLKKIWYSDRIGGTNGDVLVIHPTADDVYPQYLYQVLADEKFFSYNMKHAKGAKMPRGNKAKILEYPVPLPALKKQKEIVAILDKFDTLTNSISEGLPKEIELRQKQYEYYRDLLLDFPKEESYA